MLTSLKQKQQAIRLIVPPVALLAYFLNSALRGKHMHGRLSPKKHNDKAPMSCSSREKASDGKVGMTKFSDKFSCWRQ